MTVQFNCKDFLLKDCEFEIKGVRSVDELMRLIEVHALESHRMVKLPAETLEKILRSFQ